MTHNHVQGILGVHATALAVHTAGDSRLDITEVRDTAWGTREFHLREPDRNGLQF
jgi:hypothetical protein